jgi:serine/threonine-protein kinase RsbW
VPSDLARPDPRPGTVETRQAHHHTPGARGAATGHLPSPQGLIVQAQGAFRGSLPGFAEVRALAESFGAAAGVDHDTTLRVVLVLEELFTNTVTHGYPGGADGPVWVTLASQTGAIAITYEDAAPPFDPFGHSPALPLAPEEREPGGLGLALVRGLCLTTSYTRIGNRNRVALTVATSSAPSG